MLKSLVPNIMVESVEQTIEYYETLFGFEKLMAVPEDGEKVWALIKKDEVSLMLQNRESIVQEMPEFKDIQIGGTLSFYISVKNILHIYDSVKDKVNVIKEPFDTFYGAKEFVFKDLNGYIITMAEHQDE